MQFAPLTDAFKGYFDHLVKSQNLSAEIKEISNVKGKGMFCTSPIEGEKIIVRETPLVSLQHAENRPSAWACGNCLCFLGSIESQFNRHQQVLIQMGNAAKNESGNASFLPNSSNSSVQTFDCGLGCGESYCSDACRAEAFQKHHRFLCVGALQTQHHPLFYFKQHALQNHELFLLGAQAICVMIGRWEANGGNFEDAILPFATFPKRFWWDVATIDSGIPVKELKAMAETSLTFLKETLLPQLQGHPLYIKQKGEMHANGKGGEPTISMLLTTEFYGLLMGLFELNDQSIEIKSPLQEFLSQLPSSPEPQRSQIWASLEPTVAKIMEMQDEMDAEDEDEHEDHSCDDGKEEMEQVEKNLFERAMEQTYVFPPMQGLGLFPITATMNHSCLPNTIVKFQNNYVAHLHSLRNITVGEEMTHSYIEDADPFEDRQEGLAAYGFQCDCPKCLNKQ
eukprot:TRINITY_DN7035_c0_g1_i1.p1 TRINITY_DN7035_c0_g1~~TRINITY_DN7035_c0_g1_i1.p1  ORF type:complete len:452 (+),score=131.05 TRINITY_DN7035_c0_g1_i1:106-1461(+)